MRSSNGVCSECQEAGHELRPYGANDAPICFSCAMKPENKARSEAALAARFRACPTVVVIGLGSDGPIPIEHLFPKVRA